ncbi:hypothetical protein BH20GEM2_BH20GEM2_16810 [soil metagenome]
MEKVAPAATRQYEQNARCFAHWSQVSRDEGGDRRLAPALEVLA